MTTDPGGSTAHGPAAGRRPAPRGWRRGAGLLGELLLTLGALVLLFVVWQVWWVTREATDASAATVNDLNHQFSTTAPVAPGQGGTALQNSQFAIGQAFGIVTVPRFGNGPQPILQGNAVAQLDRGVGHDPTSAMPGQIGNFATAGHRDTYSHPYSHIDTLQPGDAIVVEVQDGRAIYRVVNKRIVWPTQTEVYAPVPDQPGVKPTEAWMTLTACTPRWTAQQRWAVHAKLEAWFPRTAEHPTADSIPQIQAALVPPADAPQGS